jgi:hypothetical protein
VKAKNFNDYKIVKIKNQELRKMLKRNFKSIMCAVFMLFMVASMTKATPAASQFAYSAIVYEKAKSVSDYAIWQLAYNAYCKKPNANVSQCIAKADLLLAKLNAVAFDLGAVRGGVGPRPIADSDFLTNASLAKISPDLIGLTTNKGGFSAFTETNEKRLPELRNQLLKEIADLKVGKLPQPVVTNPKYNSIDCVPLFIGLDVIGLTGVRPEYIPDLNASMSRCF